MKKVSGNKISFELFLENLKSNTEFLKSLEKTVQLNCNDRIKKTDNPDLYFKIIKNIFFITIKNLIANNKAIFSIMTKNLFLESMRLIGIIPLSNRPLSVLKILKNENYITNKYDNINNIEFLRSKKIIKLLELNQHHMKILQIPIYTKTFIKDKKCRKYIRLNLEIQVHINGAIIKNLKKEN